MNEKLKQSTKEALAVMVDIVFTENGPKDKTASEMEWMPWLAKSNQETSETARFFQSKEVVGPQG